MGDADKPRTMGNVFGGDVPAATWANFMRPAHEGLPVLDFAVPGLLPPPKGDLEGSVRRPVQRAPVPLARDCGGPCVRTPGLAAPTTTTTAAPAPAAEEGEPANDPVDDD